mmetsp:Transcript_4985/g.22316  ORF Transcript_4985/g.22316 Transcript_4985/m.22316 type:complete len:357 (+) Transcript_4985:276-1346(+)
MTPSPMTSLAAWLPSTYATSNVPALRPSARSDASTSRLRAFILRTGFTRRRLFAIFVEGTFLSSSSSSSSSTSFGSTPVTKRTFASNRASTAHPACASPPRSNPTSAYCSPPRHVSTQYTAESACRHSAHRSHCVLRPSQHPISITRRARVPSFIQPSWVNTAVRESALCVNQLVVNSLPAGSDGSVSADPESARRRGDGRRASWSASPSPSRGMPPAASPAWASGASPHGVSRPASQRATHGASLDAEDGPPPSSVARDDDARTPLAGVGPVSSGGAPSRVRFTGEPAAPDARSSAESARSRRDRRTPGGAGEARPSETRDGRSRSSSSRGWRPSPADAPFLVSTRGGDAAVPLG